MVALPTEPSATAAAIQEEVAAAAQKIVVSEDPRKEQLAQIARDYHDATVRIVERGYRKTRRRRVLPQLVAASLINPTNCKYLTTAERKRNQL